MSCFYGVSYVEAVALLWCYGLGRIVAARKDLEAFMHGPTPELEAPFLQFKVAILQKAVGVQLKDSLAQRLISDKVLTCLLSVTDS